MSEARIEIIVSGENAEETLAQLTSQLPADAIVADAPPAAPDAEALIEAGLAASAQLPSLIADWRETIEIAPWLVIGICVLIFAGAFLIERVLGPLFLRRLPADDTSVGPVARALRWGLRELLMLVLFIVLSRIAFFVFLPSGSEAAELARATLGSVIFVRAWYLIIGFLTAPNAPERRPTGLNDAEAGLIMRSALVFFVVSFGLSFSRDFVVAVVDAGTSGAFFAIATRILSALAIAAFFLVIRKPIAKLILLGFAADPQSPGKIIGFVARFWPVIYIALLALQILTEAQGYLAGTFGEDSIALKRSFAAFVLVPFLVAGLGIWRTHLVSQADLKLAGPIEGGFSLAEGALIVGTGIFIMYAWNIDPFATDLTGAKRILPGLVSAAIVTVIGLSLWRVASALLTDGKEKSADGGPPQEEGGTGGSRIETVMPVLRAVAAAFIATVTVLLALSSLGVQIAPLLAGAGILGLAIGFGAQKVVEDVISGVLYLVEDAFRKGEYIETAQGKGVVEAIMLRSVRLRHHLGAVFTIPFSAMGTIQNHSRDWVTVKLSFEVAPDQDLEKVRKLVKKVGAQLMDDPELEGQFLAPLKSQGAVALVGANYKIGVKFTSEPGKQFLIRRKALNAIQKAFAENDIQMAAPRVIVDTKEEAEAAAAKVAQDALAQPGAAT